MAMSDRIAVLYRGKIHQVGVPEDIYERPETKFVADFIGRNNLLDATVTQVSEKSTTVKFANGAELAVDAHRRASGLQVSIGARVAVCVRAESLRLADDGGLFSGVVTDVEYGGPVRSCIVKTDVGNLKVEVPSSGARPPSGESVRVSIAPSAVHLVGSAS
jgi:ABC-type Fe3+/spermidine/putrescine transport system ATPase subunit